MQYLTFCDPHNAADAVGRSRELCGNQSVSGEEPAPPRRVDGVEVMIEPWMEKRLRQFNFYTGGKTVSSRDVVMSGFYDTIGLYDRPAAEHSEIADAWVATLGIGDLVAATPGSFTRLSLGQQKLVLLCRAMVKRPRLLLLDEPTHGLDPHNRDRLLGMLRSLAADDTVAVVYVTHRDDEVQALGFENVLRL